MQVDHPAVGTPPRQYAAYARVVEFAFDVEEPLELVARAHVVPGEDMQPPQPPQHHVLGAPAADAIEAGELLDHRVVVEQLQSLQVEPSVNDRLGGADDGAGLALAEAEAPELLW